MHLLFSVYLPLLPLQALRPSWSEPGPYVVIDNERVLVAAPDALTLGVRPGMRSGGVAAVAPEAIALERDLQREKSMLDAAVLALYRFTPDIALEPSFGLLLDVGPSLTLFNGAPALSRQVVAALSRLGLTVQLGVAPTAAGAWLLARRGRQKHGQYRARVLKTNTLIRELDRAPCTLLPAAQPHAEWLSGVGARDLGALRRLPRVGLIRRTSTQLADALDRAYGDVPELHRWLSVPETFAATIETCERVEHAEALMEGASRLILQMVGWLTVRQLAVSAFTVQMLHERGRAAIAPTPLTIMLADPAWEEAHLLRLLKERLAKIELTASVIGLRLEANHVQPMAPPNLTLFPEPGGSPSDMLRLMELLTARLGSDRVLAPMFEDDHRPEVYNRWTPATLKPPAIAAIEEPPDRPFWLFKQPIRLILRNDRPFYGSPLTLIRGPERIEGGWWDDGTAARDYYVAQGTDAACFWIYQERTGDMQWYLHGLFA
ncbi:Y-family DNA polymerase [Massilia orientalis]|uniref:DNA polymerase Y family protein n=1 Tax=Massilia orientalis TaxID=3050128 RepID=A0ACC7MFW2_9BURK|nr:DNA polymerase Y family protein [Massilia sp. YIM B02787]